MSLSRARSVRAALAVMSTLMVSACFKPLYGGPEGAALRDDLQAIAVDPIPERTGHYLANEMHFLLNGTGSEVAPKYRLQIALHERAQASVVDSATQRATAGNVRETSTEPSQWPPLHGYRHVVGVDQCQKQSAPRFSIVPRQSGEFIIKILKTEIDSK